MLTDSWKAPANIMWLKSELMLTEVTQCLLPPSEIPRARHHQHLKGSWNWGWIITPPPPRNHCICFFFVSIGLSSTCGHRRNVMVTAILPLVLSCATIVSSHRTTRKGGISFSPTGLLFLAGVSLSLSVQHERHLPTQNQNSNYCAAVKRVVKRRRLI